VLYILTTLPKNNAEEKVDESVYTDRERKLYYLEKEQQMKSSLGEKCEWFNLLIQRVFMEYSAASLEDKFRLKINKKIARATDKPAFIVILCFNPSKYSLYK
jgi:hypothetical protein